jgi:PAS domain S-box-containing protein
VSRQRKQSIDWYTQLLELIHSTSLATDSPSALAMFLEKAGELVACDGTSILWLEGDHLSVLASTGTTVPLPGLTLPASQMGAARAVLDSGRAIAVADTTDDARWCPVPGEEQVGAWLGVPFYVDGRIIGLLEWTDRQRARFTEGDVEVAEELARHMAPILYRARLLDDTRQRLRELLEPRLATAAPPVDPEAELRQIVEEALDLTAARDAFLFLLEGRRGELRCAAVAGAEQDRLRKVTLRGDGTLAGWSMPAARAPDWLGVGPSDREKMADLGVGITLILPLRMGGEPVGMLGVARSERGRPFGQDAIRLMAHLAGQASLMVERTRRKAPEAAEYDYGQILHFSPSGIAVLTITGDIRVYNPALAGLLSQLDQRLTGRNLAEFLVPSDGQQLRQAIEELAVTGQRRHLDARVLLASGEYRHMRMSLSFAHVSSDPGGNLVVIVEDVTRLKILEEERVEHLGELRQKHTQLQELDKLKSRFVSNVSHELRTPLAVIKLYATLARKGRPEKQKFYLQTIEQETHRLETMVENILDLTRLDRQALTVQPESLPTREIVGQILEVYQETANNRGIELVNRLSGEVPPLWADKNHFIQMLTNLLDNALKYTPRGGQIWVEAGVTRTSARRMLEVAVGDQGCGIPEDELDKVFERFYRGSNNNPGSTGTGLGLSIVQELMAQHRGKVTVKSRVGEGSVFALQFPLGRPDDRD